MRALAIALLPIPLSAQWIRVETPGIELFTDAGEKSGRALLDRFEQVRSIFRQAGIADGPIRLRVLAFSSVDEFHRYRADSDGFYQSGADRDYIALHTGPEAGRVAFHEYVHLVLRHSSVALPRWFDEGLSEFYSTAELEKDRLRIGKPIPSHLALLANARWLDAAGLDSTGKGSLFYAESWALVHMLNLGPRWRDGMPQFVLLLAREKPAETAFREAFGRSLQDALGELPAYLKSMRPAVVAAVAGPAPPPNVSRIGAAAAALARAGLALNMKQPEFAESLLEGLAGTPDTEAMRGAVALAANRRDEARRHLDRAIALGNRDASLYFEYATLEHESGRPDSPMLRKVLEVDPDFADAAFLLGVRETDDGDLKNALPHLRAAVRVRPDRSGYWHALAYAQARSGDFESSARSARRAMAAAENDQEMQAAEALPGLERAAPPPAPRPAVITPPSWQPRKGDARIEGTLTFFDCGSSPPRIEVRSAAGLSLTLVIRHPSEIELVNSPTPALQLPCGALDLHVAVDYDRASADVTRIDFRL